MQWANPQTKVISFISILMQAFEVHVCFFRDKSELSELALQ